VDRLHTFLKRQPQIFFHLEIALLFGAIGLIDYVTGYEIAIYPFYGIPILLMVWFGNVRAAIAISVASAVTWWAIDIADGHVYGSEWFRAWDAIAKLIFFVLVLLTAWSVRRQRDEARERIELLEHSQRLEDEIINISENEQQRIGRDLHDGVCQYLAAIGFTASMFKQELEKRSKSDALRMEDIVFHLRDAAARVRQLARGLSPVDCDEGGLELAFDELAMSTTKLTGITCSFISSGPVPKLTNATAVHLFRIGQEAVSNAVNHGKAKNIVIALDISEDGYSLRISDDGIGFVPPGISKDGMGLGSMRYRARVMRGTLEIQATSPSGTVVICTVPDNAWAEQQPETV
jgi:signal transduction histidine kinase